MATYLQARNQKPKAKNQKSGIGVLPRGDYPLIAAIGALAVLGLLMVYSGSYDLAFQAQDGNAAYQNALMWCLTGNEAHAKKAGALFDRVTLNGTEVRGPSVLHSELVKGGRLVFTAT